MGFTIKSRLGRGRSVESFAATLDVDGDRFDVVVKRPRSELKNNAAFAEALLAWGASQRDIDQENVVAVLEVGRTEEGPYVLQEWVEGAPLSAAIQALRRRKRTLMPSLALALAEQAAAGLTHLHRKGIIHGGLDTGEVLLSYAGEAKIGDQRLRTLDRYLGADLIPDDADLYRAPEVRDASDATEPGDVYALGLITLELLIGTAVWAADSMTIDGSIAALKDFTHVGQAQPALTEDLVALLRACLAERPAERATARRALEQIKAVVAKHRIHVERQALGDFLKALIPPPEAAEAPTMMVDPETAEQIAAQHSARVARFEGLSVPLDPDLERKALTRAVRPVSVPPELPPAPLPKPDFSAPSVARSRAVSVPNVAKVAVRAASEFDRSVGRNLRLAAAAVGGLVLLLIAIAMFRGDHSRSIRLRVSSVPAGADLFVDGVAVGATPVNQDLVVEGQTVQLRFTLDGYREHKVSIGTDAAELRYEAPLEKDE